MTSHTLDYRAFFENANDAIYFIKRGNRIFDCNPKTMEMYGCTREQIIGKAPYDFSPPLQPDGRNSREKAHEIIKAAFDGEIRSFEWRHCTYDGTPFDTEVSLTRIGSGDETVIQAIVRDVTRRKQAEEALHHANRTLSDIIDFLPDATVVIDKEKRVIAWNRAMEKMTGVQKEDILGKGDHAYAIPFYGEPRPLLIELVGIMDEEIQSRYDFVIRDGDRVIAETHVPALYGGRGAYLRGVASPLFDGEGRITGAIETIRDITERKEAERRLKESESLYRLLAENISDVIWTMDMDFHFKYISPSVMQFRGYTAEEAMSQSLNEVLTPTSYDVAINVFREELAKERMGQKGFAPGVLELEFVRKDGATLWTEVSIMFLRDADNRPTALLGVTRDITKRKLALDRLRESEIKYRTLVDNMNVAILIMKGDVFVDCNSGAPAVFGCAREEIIGEVVHRFYPVDQSDERSSETKIRQRIDAALAGEPQFYESKACRYGGTPFDAEISLNRIELEGEHLIQAVVRDITHRKVTMRELERKSVSLEEVNIALRVLLQQRERDKDDLEGKILRNVNELVLPYIDILKQRRLDEQQAIYLDVLETNLRNIISPFMQKMTSLYGNLTPAEIKVANFLRDGKTVKEIAKILGVSKNSINSHRQHIRNKLGLANKKTSLKTYLMSLT